MVFPFHAFLTLPERHKYNSRELKRPYEEIIMSDMQVQQVLNQMKILSQNNILPETNSTDRPEFSKLLNDSINQVNSLQQDATALKTAYEMGDSNVDIPEVMVAVQKASLSFEAITEVRNKLLSAYQEVMNMPV